MIECCVVDHLGIVGGAQALAESIGARYLELKGHCERQVAEWRFATNQMYDPRPFHHLLIEGDCGRWVASEKRGRCPFAYGQNADQHIVVEREYQGGGCREKFYFRGSDCIVGVQYPYDFKDIQWVDICLLDGGLPFQYYRHSPLKQVGSLEQRFAYDNKERIIEARCIDVRFGVERKWTYFFDWSNQEIPDRITAKSDEGDSETVFINEERHP